MSGIAHIGLVTGCCDHVSDKKFPVFRPFPLPTVRITGTILPKILQGQSFLTCHPSAEFLWHWSSFPGRACFFVCESVFQHRYSIGVKLRGISHTTVICHLSRLCVSDLLSILLGIFSQMLILLWPYIYLSVVFPFCPSVLWCCWLGNRKVFPACKDSCCNNSQKFTFWNWPDLE